MKHPEHAEAYLALEVFRRALQDLSYGGKVAEDARYWLTEGDGLFWLDAATSALDGDDLNSELVISAALEKYPGPAAPRPDLIWTDLVGHGRLRKPVRKQKHGAKIDEG